MSETENWSREWNSSTDPSKQRKYRDNAPLHVKDKMISANTSEVIREELGTRSIQLKVGDRVRVMRGDEKGKEGIVSDIDREEEKVYVHGIIVERTDGTEREIALRPSNLQVQAMNIEDDMRMEKYDIDDFEAIRVEEEEMEEALEEDEEGEMMEQMQTGESSLEAGEDEEEDTEDEEETEDEVDEETSEEETAEDEDASGTDYDDIVDNTISDAKEQLQELEEPDYQAALEAEENNKDRKTFKEWLENKAE